MFWPSEDFISIQEYVWTPIVKKFQLNLNALNSAGESCKQETDPIDGDGFSDSHACLIRRWSASNLESALWRRVATILFLELHQLADHLIHASSVRQLADCAHINFHGELNLHMKEFVLCLFFPKTFFGCWIFGTGESFWVPVTLDCFGSTALSVCVDVRVRSGSYHVWIYSPVLSLWLFWIWVMFWISGSA